MMLLNDLYTKLSYGELSNTAIGMEGAGTITEEGKPRIVNYVNEGLIRLYSEFLIREKEVMILMYKEITFYHLITRFAVNAGAEANLEARRYLLDLPEEPFENDVLKILTVYNSARRRLPLNDAEMPGSVFTPQPTILQVPFPVEGAALTVSYQANHPVMHYNEPTGRIDLPDALNGALTAWVAYKVFSHMNTQESTAKAQEHLEIYQAIVQQTKDMDLVNASVSGTTHVFEKRGFV
jgi:hypothetical protein